MGDAGGPGPSGREEGRQEVGDPDFKQQEELQAAQPGCSPPVPGLFLRLPLPASLFLSGFPRGTRSLGTRAPHPWHGAQHALSPFLYECFYISVLGFAVIQD